MTSAFNKLKAIEKALHDDTGSWDDTVSKVGDILGEPDTGSQKDEVIQLLGQMVALYDKDHPAEYWVKLAEDRVDKGYPSSVPLLMGDKIIGVAHIELATGDMTAKIDPLLTNMLNDYLKGQLLSMSFYGRAGVSGEVMQAHEEVAAYLKEK